MVGKILNINNEYKHYGDYKAAVDEELRRSAESFVRIGYLLKVARDTDILTESGYKSVTDFAQAEYNLDKSQVSRFIRINDEFSEGGYSDHLQERYQGFGHAKLSMMLMLPSAVKEEISADFSKSEIQAIKEEVDAEQKITELEVWMEEKDKRQQSYGIFEKVLHQMGKENPALYQQLHRAMKENGKETAGQAAVRNLINILAPMGEAIHSVRIAGEGRKLLSIKGEEIEPTITDIRSGEKETCSWDDFILYLESFCEETDAQESWERLYGEAFPLEEKQQGKESSKISRVNKAKEPVKVPKPVEKQQPDLKAEKESGNGSSQEKEGQEESRLGQVHDSSPEKETGDFGKGKEIFGSSPEKEGQEESKFVQEKATSGSSQETGEKKEENPEINTNHMLSKQIPSTPNHILEETGQLTGQMSVENYPEMLPQNYKAAPVQPNIQGRLVKESMCLEAFRDTLEKACDMTEKREYDKAKRYLSEAMERLERLKDFMEETEYGKETT